MEKRRKPTGRRGGWEQGGSGQTSTERGLYTVIKKTVFKLKNYQFRDSLVGKST